MATEKNKTDLQEKKDISDDSKSVSAKKIIYAEIDDEITDIYKKVKNCDLKNIYIVVPKRATIFQSIVNLKILNTKAKALNKRLNFISNDSNGIYLAQKLGIPIYDKTNNEGKPSLFSFEEDDQLRITPLKASVNSLDEESPMRLSKKKLSISELLKNSKTAPRKNSMKKLRAEKKRNTDKPRSKFVLISPNRHALIGLISVSVIILLVIVYIALPGATIHLTPAAGVIEKSANITLADYSKNMSLLEQHPHNTIASYPVDITVEKNITHYSTGKKFSQDGRHASGKIKVINTTSNTWPLIANTRFQTDEGLVFRIREGITVPPATSAGPGEIEAYVIADPVDAFGEVIGERGNIGPSRFFLPGLRDDSRSKVYAQSDSDMTGGITDYTAYISEEDLLSANEKIKNELIKGAEQALEEEVLRITKEVARETGGNITYALLKGDNAVKIGDPKINIDQSLKDQPLVEFTASGSIYASGVYYDRGAMLEILKNELLLKKSPQKELLRIREDSLSYRIFERDEYGGKIKLTANIKGIEQYIIDPKTEEGEKLLEKIRAHVLGAEIETAKKYIQNLPEINTVEVESWPYWAPTIPTLPENVKFTVREAIIVN